MEENNKPEKDRFISILFFVIMNKEMNVFIDEKSKRGGSRGLLTRRRLCILEVKSLCKVMTSVY